MKILVSKGRGYLLFKYNIEYGGRYLFRRQYFGQLNAQRDLSVVIPGLGLDQRDLVLEQLGQKQCMSVKEANRPGDLTAMIEQLDAFSLRVNRRIVLHHVLVNTLIGALELDIIGGEVGGQPALTHLSHRRFSQYMLNLELLHGLLDRLAAQHGHLLRL